MHNKPRLAPAAQEVAVAEMEKTMLAEAQVECPVAHLFGPGIYIREVSMPAGTLAVGHAQKFRHSNILLKGSVAIVEDGAVKILKAPMFYIGEPGKKFGYILEDTVWQNVYATDETDIDKLEEMFLDKSEAFLKHQQSMLAIQKATNNMDRYDFKRVITLAGFSEETVRNQSENTSDQIKMPHGYAWRTTVRESQLEGKGLFLTSPACPGEVIAPARINGMRTPAGRYTNHSKYPNAEFLEKDGDIFLVAKSDIKGCVGGGIGDEITVDYRQALSLSGITLEEYDV